MLKNKVGTIGSAIFRLRLANQMASVMEAKRKLHANMNPQLLMEQLVLELQEG